MTQQNNVASSLIIIGCGPGGYRTAAYAAQQGLSVTIIEKAEAGGTCLNCGCIPTKALCHDAELAAMGVPVDFSAMMQRKQSIVEQLRGGVEQLMQQPGITFIRGEASLCDAHTVAVRLRDDSETEPMMLTADNIIIATGARAKLPPIEGIDLDGVVTSTELLDITDLPKRLVIVGAGVIGMEFANIFKSLGSEVIVIEFLKECLPAMDGDIAKRLRKLLEKRGVEFSLQSGVKSITKDECLHVAYEKKGKTAVADADIVLVATGRAANVEGLNLDAVGVEVDRRGIVVDAESFETSVKNIYAIGDVNGRQMLAHAATYQGLHVVNHILGRKDNINLDIMPAAVFTQPEAAGVGMAEEQLKDAGTPFTVHKGYYRANGKALAMGESEGLVKLFTDEQYRIVGCHILGAHASDMVQEVATMMNRQGTLQQLRDTVHIHPTLSEILTELS
ncbi:MAG: dihydrolipoyl dehydrogenase [Bacteroidaceae bacterium]|nr:dihydrolipoyl dehydrogenase [Bacteroidaceae bacterium]